MQALIGQDAFVLLTSFYKGGEKQGRCVWIPAQNHCGNDWCYKNLDDDGSLFSLAIMHLRGHSKRKASGFAEGYLLNNRPGYFLIYWIP